MTYRYNKGIFVHIIIEVTIFIIMLVLHGVFGAIFITTVSIVFSTIVLNCYRIDITEDSMTIYQIYGGSTKLSWDEVKSVEIGRSTIEIPVIGSVKNMTIQFDEQKELVINIEPVEREEMTVHIERLCKIKGITFSV